jgi:hypothetical protein
MSEACDMPLEAAAERLCIDCRWCTDGGVPRRPGNLLCTHPDPYHRSGVFYTILRRQSARYCGKDARWFEDALLANPQV